ADEELVRVAEAQLQRAKEELQISVNKFQAGAATRSDTLTARVDFGNAQLALLQANANLATAQANLGRQVGVDQPVRAVPDTAFPSLPDTTALRAQALDSSPQVQQAEARARAAGGQVGAQLTQQLAAVTTAYAQFGITGANVAAATEALRVTQERYKLGAGTLLDLLTAEANMTQAQVNQVQSRYNYLIARAQVEALVGHPL